MTSKTTDRGADKGPSRQVAVVAYRMRSGRAEVLLITSSGGKRWILPKGKVKRGELAHRSARREAEEEAGLTGAVHPRPIGSFRQERRSEDACRVEVYLMRVTRVFHRWEEDAFRLRKWVALDKAERRLKVPRARTILRAAAQRVARSA